MLKLNRQVKHWASMFWLLPGNCYVFLRRHQITLHVYGCVCHLILTTNRKKGGKGTLCLERVLYCACSSVRRQCEESWPAETQGASIKARRGCRACVQSLSTQAGSPTLVDAPGQGHKPDPRGGNKVPPVSKGRLCASEKPPYRQQPKPSKLTAESFSCWTLKGTQ